MLDAQRFDWIKQKGGEWEPARYVPSDGDYPQHFVTTKGKRLPMQEVLLIGQPLIPPDAREVTVRDQFAMAALSEVCRQCSVSGHAEIEQMASARGGGMTVTELCAVLSYEMADAMMKTREGK